MITDFVQNCIDGIMVGSGYSLLALGFTLVFGVLKRLNLSYGPGIMLGAYVGTWSFLNIADNIWLVLLTTICATVVIGIYVEQLCFRASSRETSIASMVSSFAIWMQLEEIALHLLPERTYPFPAFFDSGLLEFGPFTARSEYLFMFVVMLLLLLILHAFIYRTRIGLAIRAYSDHPSASAYMGINGSSVLILAFIIVSIIGGIAGFLILSADSQITPFFGLWATFKGLIAMMLGGIGSLSGAVLGGLILGIIETNAFWYGDPVIRDISSFMLLFTMLIIRPGGIFGHKIEIHQKIASERV